MLASLGLAQMPVIENLESMIQDFLKAVFQRGMIEYFL
jgi:hypothetical protein